MANILQNSLRMLTNSLNRVAEEISANNNMLQDPIKVSQNQSSSQQDSANSQTFIYIVLGALVLGFLFFVGNTIRCYLNRPRYIDDDQEDMVDHQMGTSQGHGHSHHNCDGHHHHHGSHSHSHQYNNKGARHLGKINQ